MYSCMQMGHQIILHKYLIIKMFPLGVQVQHNNVIIIQSYNTTFCSTLNLIPNQNNTMTSALS